MRANKFFNIVTTLGFASFLIAGCGQKVNGNYALTQSGLTMANQAGCNAINLAINENNGQVSGSGSNACFTETLMGTSNSGVIQATITITPTYNANSGTNNGAYSYSQNQSCMYTGQLTVNGNLVSGTLSPSTGGAYNSMYNTGYNTGYNPYNTGYNTGNNTGMYGQCGGSIQITGTKN